jgi:hypothetical protein
MTLWRGLDHHSLKFTSFPMYRPSEAGIFLLDVCYTQPRPFWGLLFPHIDRDCRSGICACWCCRCPVHRSLIDSRTHPLARRAAAVSSFPVHIVSLFAFLSVATLVTRRFFSCFPAITCTFVPAYKGEKSWDSSGMGQQRSRWRLVPFFSPASFYTWWIRQGWGTGGVVCNIDFEAIVVRDEIDINASVTDRWET